LRRGRRRGAQMVEFAIILPVLVFCYSGSSNTAGSS
jgi:Flp pilus assembly protein TadG